MSNSSQNYNERFGSKLSEFSTNRATEDNFISASRRPDGSYREEIRVRPGFVPEAEKPVYVPPAARKRLEMMNPEGEDDEEERIDSWADESAPVISEICSKTSELEVAEDEESSEEQEDSFVENESKIIVGEGTPAKVIRKPSELATAIDNALDNLSLTGSDPLAPRQIGRFATQIANDEREGRPYYRRYERNYDGYRSGDQNNSGSYNSGYRSGDQSYNGGYGGGYRNGDQNSNGYNGGYRSEGYKSSYYRRENSSQDLSRVEGDYKNFMEELLQLRKEMAVINVKLEYIRYMKSRDSKDLSEVEKERIEMEGGLVERLDALFEAVDALSSK